MKFIAGRSVESVLDEMDEVPIEVTIAALTQVAGGLGYGHRRGVIHRDVKPGNVMIDEDGTAIITDFGIARVEDSTGRPRPLTPVTFSGLAGLQMALDRRSAYGALSHA